MIKDFNELVFFLISVTTIIVFVIIIRKLFGYECSVDFFQYNLFTGLPHDDDEEENEIVKSTPVDSEKQKPE
jgi:hypothetical protein